MKERPALFSGPMVRAIMRTVDPKTQTRRVMKGQVPPYQKDGDWYWINKGKNYKLTGFVPEQRDGSGLYPFGMEEALAHCPYGQHGDRLWVRETWREWHENDADCGCSDYCNCRKTPPTPVCYAADWGAVDEEDHAWLKWRPSIFMPRKYSRITLEITDIRIQHVRDISEADARAEGAFKQGKVGDDPVSPLWTMTGDGWRHDFARGAFASFWDVINGIKHPWCSNPWVWAVSFKRVQ